MNTAKPGRSPSGEEPADFLKLIATGSLIIRSGAGLDLRPDATLVR